MSVILMHVGHVGISQQKTLEYISPWRMRGHFTVCSKGLFSDLKIWVEYLKKCSS